ncbi:dynamin family protein [Jeotgalibacillus marinus]|uniref:Dynamin family protein n=1 Tax=Jeotgalibacillus marinus TaxID=86667 RepID=A0ABV3Q3D2_9BACL
MERQLFEENKENLLYQLAEFHSQCVENQDETRAIKIEKLAHKLVQEELIVAFCGHFSAGKSAMINRLMGEEILPSSPIPTSANLIAIHTGENKNIRVTTNDNQIIELLPSLDETVIGELGKDGVKIKRIDLYRTKSNIPTGVTVLDTPGIDSVDDAHKQSTESAIHLADLCFYVMDYNHVQSQMNFEYIRNLIHFNRPVHAIINQIDKHRDEELPFSIFKQSTEEAFAAWEATPKAFHYTTLKDQSHAHNEIDGIHSYVTSLMDNRKEVILQTTTDSLSMLKQEHHDFLLDEYKDMLDIYSDFLSKKEIDEKELVFQKEETFKKKHQSYSLGDWIESFNKEQDQLLKSAYLMPAEVREKAQLFLEAMQPSFKIGLLFSSKKTAEERIKRTEEFVETFQSVVQRQLEWHMKNCCHTSLKRAGIVDVGWSNKIDKIAIIITGERVEKLVKRGAEVNGQSVLNYCEDVAKSIRSEAKSKLVQMKKQLLNDFEQMIEDYTVQSEKEWMTIHQKANALRYLTNLELKISFPHQPTSDDIQKTLLNWRSDWNRAEEEVTYIDELSSYNGVTSEEISVTASGVVQKDPSVKWDEKKVIHNLNLASEHIKGLKGFERQRELLLRRIKKLQSKDFTIALFGAFSAGKSSFANALLGKKVLPVSPNPTTASINKIKPPNNENPDGTVHIFLKKQEGLLNDLQEVMADFNHYPKDLQEAYIMATMIVEKGILGNDTKKSFIQAFIKGWKTYKDNLGERLHVSRVEFEGYVANEHQSCFVESIDYYVDSPLGDEGVTIVDTPGADSINARHTDVSFDYIRNADAILFVTYYNHAFAHADREFLIQLGRVKESFELDKMFFVVNAVDLAESEKEKELVLAYIKDQLIAFGIRFPRIFGVSSLQAISGDQTVSKKSGIDLFKEDFHDFLRHDLHGMALSVANRDFNMVVQRIEGLIESSKQSDEQKKEKLTILNQSKSLVLSRFENPQFHSVEKRSEQELNELLFYMEQRVFYRFSDFFKESFNPTLFIQQSSQKALQEAIISLLKMLGFDFAQELRVINHRMAQFIEHQIANSLEIEWTKVRSIFPEGIRPQVEWEEKELVTFTTWFQVLNPSEFKTELSSFKNTKSFFEKNEKKVMRDKLEARLRKITASEIKKEQSRLVEWVDEQFSTTGRDMYNRWRCDLLDQIDSALEGLQSDEVIEHWTHAYQRITEGSIT